MGCGCRKRTGNDSRSARVAVDAAASMRYEVWIGGRFSGRSFTSLIAAQSWAHGRNGEVRAV